MLVLSRQRDETIMIGDDIEVTVVDIRGDKVRLGINAPKEISVHRKEVYDAIRRENKAAAQVKTLGILVPVYLEVREKGDEYWPKLRRKRSEEVTRYLTKAWQPVHGVAVDQITRQMVKDRRDEIAHLLRVGLIHERTRKPTSF